MLRFSFDHFQETVLHPDRRHDQTVPALRLRISGKHVEYSSCVFPEPLIAGENTAVCIQLGCRIIVVTGCKMHITADSRILTAHYQGNLAVGLQANQTVNNMAACFFQHFCPHNVVLLIKTGLQFHQNRNLLAVLCCLCKSRNNRGIAADTVQSLLDGQNIRILGSLAHEIYNRVKAHVWVMKEHISFPDHLENILAGICKCRNYSRGIFRLFILVETILSVHLHQHG